MSDTGKTTDRPLAPHLQVYRLPQTAWMSISHRATGFALSVGTLMLTWMLVAAAAGPDVYETFLSFAGSLLGKIMLFGWSFALIYHMANGVRHLIWDTGALLTLKGAFRAGCFIIGFTVAATLLFWCLAGGL